MQPYRPAEHWKKALHARGLLRNAAGEILVAGVPRRNGGVAWTLPGGRLEDGESLAEAAAREFWEETGLHVIPGDLLCIVERLYQQSRTYRLSFVYYVQLRDPAASLRLADITGINDPDQVVQEFTWLTPAALAGREGWEPGYWRPILAALAAPPNTIPLIETDRF